MKPSRSVKKFAAALGVAVLLSCMTALGASAQTAGLVKAQKATAAAVRLPTSIGVSTPLKYKPPTGKTVVFINCNGTPQCTEIGQGFGQAVNAIGWKLKTLQYDQSQPASIIASMQTALQFHPVAVFFVGAPYSTWENEVPAYVSAGVKIIDTGLTAPQSTAIIQPGPDAPQSGVDGGTTLANWFISQSKGKGRAAFVTVPAFPTSIHWQTGFTNTVRSNCSTCSVKIVNVTIAQYSANQMNQLVVATLQRDPSIGYVLFDVPADGLPNALQAAGLAGKVKNGGAFWDATNIAGLRNGTQDVFVSEAQSIQGWQAMDQLLRTMQGLPVPSADGLPTAYLLTKANVQTVTNTTQYIPAFNFESQYKKLWLVK